jgi:hypothetical protein
MAVIRSSGTFSLRPERGGTVVSYRPPRAPKQHSLTQGLGTFTVTRPQHAAGYRSGAAAMRAERRAVRSSYLPGFAPVDNRPAPCPVCFLRGDCLCGDGAGATPNVGEHVATDYLLADD